MLMTIIALTLCAICITSAYFLIKKVQINKELENNNEKLYNIYSSLKERIEESRSSLEVLQHQEQMSDNAFQHYFELLEKKYSEVDADYQRKMAELEEVNDLRKQEIAEQLAFEKQELEKLKATRISAIQAFSREDDLSKYCLELSEIDKNDILRIRTIRPLLVKPRALDMLIWQTWIQKPFKTLINNIVGVKDKCGIYKITNLQTKECYIGQSRTIKDRWVDHMKCGLGIDTPAGNKLYAAMQKYEVWNFSFEVLEECPPEHLNEKEKYYIELYSSLEVGYNSNKGIGELKWQKS